MSTWTFSPGWDEYVRWDGDAGPSKVSSPTSGPVGYVSGVDPLPATGTRVDRRLHIPAAHLNVTGPFPVWLVHGTRNADGDWTSVDESHTGFTVTVTQTDTNDYGSGIAAFGEYYSPWVKWVGGYDPDANPLSLYVNGSSGSQQWRYETGANVHVHAMYWQNPDGHVEVHRMEFSGVPFLVEMRGALAPPTKPRGRIYPRDDTGRIYPTPTATTIPGHIYPGYT